MANHKIIFFFEDNTALFRRDFVEYREDVIIADGHILTKEQEEELFNLPSMIERFGDVIFYEDHFLLDDEKDEHEEFYRECVNAHNNNDNVYKMVEEKGFKWIEFEEADGKKIMSVLILEGPMARTVFGNMSETQSEQFMPGPIQMFQGGTKEGTKEMIKEMIKEMTKE